MQSDGSATRIGVAINVDLVVKTTVGEYDAGGLWDLITEALSVLPNVTVEGGGGHVIPAEDVMPSSPLSRWIEADHE